MSVKSYYFLDKYFSSVAERSVVDAAGAVRGEACPCLAGGPA
jgi:hypothetical protein